MQEGMTIAVKRYSGTTAFLNIVLIALFLYFMVCLTAAQCSVSEHRVPKHDHDDSNG